MKLVLLERESVGLDIDVSRYQNFGELTEYANTVTKQEVRERVASADIIIANKAPMTEETLSQAPNVRLICNFATGYDNIDLDYCSSRKITVTNIQNYATVAVAQHTFAMALYVLEHLHYYDNYVKSGAYSAQGRFSNFHMPFTELDKKVWGIAGMGNIGKKVAEIASAFGCQVIFYATSGYSSCTNYKRVDFETLLQESDFISLRCPLTDKTRNMMDAKAFSNMKSTAILLNVARGAVVNSTDLYHALLKNKIAGAGLDVLDYEPIRSDNPLSEFQDSNRLLITPHMAWASTEARERCVAEVYDNIKAYLEGNPIHVVS